MTDTNKETSAERSDWAKAQAASDAKRTTALKWAVAFAVVALAFSVLAAIFMEPPPDFGERLWRWTRVGYVGVAAAYLALRLWELRQHLSRTHWDE